MSADDEVIQRAKDGDPEAWRELYRAHAGRLVVWLGTRPSGDAALAPEDLAAEAWLTAAQKIADFNGSSSDFAGWIFGISRNLAANAYRRSTRRETSPIAFDTVTDATRHAPSHEGHEGLLVGRDWVNRMLSALPPRERDVVACIDVVGLDVEGTARALEISAVAVRVARHRGLRRLRRLGTDPDQASSNVASIGSR